MSTATKTPKAAPVSVPAAAEPTSAADRCHALLCADTGLPLAEVQKIELETLLGSAIGWGHSPILELGGRSFGLSQRTVEAIAEWLIADRAPDRLAQREADRRLLETLDAKGYRIVMMDNDNYWVAESGEMPLGQAAREFARWELMGGCKIAILPPGADDNYV